MIKLINKVKPSIPFYSFIILILLLQLISCTEKSKNNSEHTEYSRIISLSPSTTETLFLLGVGDKVVGVTRYCTYPPEAKLKEDVGGFIDPNYEAIMLLKPDLVIVLPEHQKVKKYLSQIGVKYIEVNNKTLPNILDVIKTIGKVCKVEDKANDVIKNMNKVIKEIKEKTSKLQRKKVLVSVGRSFGSGSINDSYIAGPSTHFSELITIAGGTNAFDKKNMSYPMLSAEGIIQLNPDIIIDIVPDAKKSDISEEKLKEDWNSLVELNTINKDNIFIYTKDYSAIPGPRIIYLLQDFAKIIHPEIDWDF